jgi:hypothetical protein
MSMSARKNRHQKIDKRYGHKMARQETRRVLENGVMPKITHGAHWSPTIEQPPIPDGAVTGGPRAKKPRRKKKERCPVNRVHEWYIEIEIVTEEFRHWWTNEWRTSKAEVQTRTCIQCWKIQKRSRRLTSAYTPHWTKWRP